VRAMRTAHLFWILALAGLALVFIAQRPESRERNETFLAKGYGIQLDTIRDIASDHGWKVGCEGRSGSMTVLRLEPGFWPWRSERNEVWTEMSPVSAGLVAGGTFQPVSPTCDLPDDSRQTMAIEESREVAVAVGPRDRMMPLLALVPGCDITSAKLQPARLVRDALWFDDEPPADWMAVTIDLREDSDYGPNMCFVQMTQYVYHAAEE